MPAALFLRSLEFPLTAKRKRTVFQFNVDILHLKPRNVGLHDELVLGLFNVHRGDPGPAIRLANNRFIVS